MEPLGLLAVLLVIVFAGYVVIQIAFEVANIVFEFVENNFLKVAAIALVVLALWLSQH
jgi:hypothetical protein